ncbi:MAG: alpha/beta hydrolase [Sedimentisphaerales bacterium]
MICRYFDSVEKYLDFYGLEADGHKFVPFKSNGFELAGQLFKPKEYKATVVILHGYLGHYGTFGKYTKHLLETGFAVAAYDLPGHGLSSGEPAVIDDFSQYSDSLGDFLKIVRSHLNGPYHIIGHSSGAAVIVDYLLEGRPASPDLRLPRGEAEGLASRGGEDCFDKVVLAAPLVRCWLWSMTKIGYKIYHPFAKNIFRVFWNLSSDKDYFRFVKYRDPLQGRKVSLNWVKALFKWNEKINNAQKINKPILVIQGTNDATVAWKYNLKFIQSKFSRAEIELVENAQHELFNESAYLRKKVFSLIRSYLEN